MSDLRDYSNMSHDDMWQKMRKGWQSKETICGSGSEFEKTVAIRKWLPKLLVEYDVHSIVDAGAGDLHWIEPIIADYEYTALDLIPRHERVMQFDLTQQIPPCVDLIICRFVVNHLSFTLAMKVLENLVLSGSTHILITNWDKQIAYWEQNGFRLPRPIKSFEDANFARSELHLLRTLL